MNRLTLYAFVKKGSQLLKREIVSPFGFSCEKCLEPTCLMMTDTPDGHFLKIATLTREERNDNFIREKNAFWKQKMQGWKELPRWIRRGIMEEVYPKNLCENCHSAKSVFALFHFMGHDYYLKI